MTALSGFLQLIVHRDFVIHIWLVDALPALKASLLTYLSVSDPFSAMVEVTGAKLFLAHERQPRKFAVLELWVVVLPSASEDWEIPEPNARLLREVFDSSTRLSRAGFQNGTRALIERDAAYEAEVERVRVALMGLFDAIDDGALLAQETLMELFVAELEARSLVVPPDLGVKPSETDMEVRADDVEVVLVVVEEQQAASSSDEDGMPVVLFVVIIGVVCLVLLLIVGFLIYKIQHLRHLVKELQHNHANHGFRKGLARTMSTALRRSWSGSPHSGWSYNSKKAREKELQEQESDLQHQRAELEHDREKLREEKSELRMEKEQSARAGNAPAGEPSKNGPKAAPMLVELEEKEAAIDCADHEEIGILCEDLRLWNAVSKYQLTQCHHGQHSKRPENESK